MKKIFNKGEMTQKIESYIDGFECIEKTEITDFLKNPKYFPDFHQGFKEFLIKKGYVYKDNDDLFRHIKECSRMIPLDDSTIKSFKNWIYNINNPQSNNTSRDNIYKLCFALQFTYNDVVEFFYKVYLSRPFDCRRLDEAIYLYCFNNQKSYFDYKRIKSKVETYNSELSHEKFGSTMAFITSLEQIYDESAFINYVANNAFFSRSNMTALDKCEDLFNQAMAIPIQVKGDYINVTSSKHLYEIIVGEYYRLKKEDTNHEKLTEDVKKTKLKKLLEANFPKMIYKNFPKEQDFSTIKNKKSEVTYETLRKVLILLKFYIFAQEKDNWDRYDDFADEMNDLLDVCGYQGLYYRNPYDWLFLHCFAQREDEYDTPLDEFHRIFNGIFK